MINMLGPSGFFIPDAISSGGPDSNALDLIHTSADGFNELYRGVKNGRFFVYKALKKEYRGQPLYEELLKKDFNIGFSLNHTGICQYYAMVNLPETGNCIIMEWIDGITLEAMIADGTPDSNLARKIICEVCDALDYIHRKQVIHRDLKPENIMITNNGQHVKIIDFGLSDADSFNIFKAPAGTRIYASPELISGEATDGRSDLWSLGMIINELSGKYRHVSRKCLQRDKEKRFGSANEVKQAIMKEGARKATLWLVSLLLTAGLAASLLTFRAYTEVATDIPLQSPAELPAIQSDTTRVRAEETTAAKPTETKAVTPAEPVQQPDNIDAESLDDLFNDAVLQIL